jgi:hypothetical protein
MNYKQIGDVGQNCVIGELSKYCLGVAFPLSDNYPFDFVVIANELFKVQVKSSSQHVNGSVVFDLSTNNFYTGETKTYDADEVDAILCYDLREHRTFILTHDDINGNRTVSLRYKQPKNKQKNRIRWATDYELSETRVKDVFGWDTPDLTRWHASINGNVTQYDHICLSCGEKFTNGRKNAKYCSDQCRTKASRKVARPAKDELALMVETMNWRSIGKKFGVSCNAVRKWARSYGLI